MACSTAAGNLPCQTTSISTATITSLIVTTLESTFTTTRQIITTCYGTPGQTVTITPPSSPWYIDPSTSRTSTLPPTPTTSPTSTSLVNVTPVFTASTSSITNLISAPTATITEIVVVLQNTNGDIYTTSTLTLPAATTTFASWLPPTPFTVVLGQKQENGWNTWSDAEKGGLIAGCAIVFLALLFIILCWCLRKKSVWIAHDRSVNSHPGFIAGHPEYGHGSGCPRMRGGGNGGEQTLTEKTKLNGWYKTSHGCNRSSNQLQCSKQQHGGSSKERTSFYRPPVHE